MIVIVQLNSQIVFIKNLIINGKKVYLVKQTMYDLKCCYGANIMFKIFSLLFILIMKPGFLRTKINGKLEEKLKMPAQK